MKFTLEIELGNEAMQVGADVAAALRTLAKTVYRFENTQDFGKIMDANGNSVGRWEVTETATEGAATTGDDYDERAAIKQGWALIDDEKRGLEIQKYDEDTRFESDEDALNYVKRRASEGDWNAIAALAKLKEAE